MLTITCCLAIPGLQCCLIRKKLSDIIDNHVEGPTGYRVLLAPLLAAKAARITRMEGVYFGNGSVINFTHCQDERQFDTAQGIEKHLLCIDEATQISERLIRFFRTWCRAPEEWLHTLPPQWQGYFPRILYTANPIGTSAPFFRRAFVKSRPAGVIERVEGFDRQYIPSRATDNASINLESHKSRLAGLHDPALAKAIDEGDWDAPVGEFYPQYDESRHVCANFTPPAHWFKFMTFDWGSAEPFCVLWWAVSDGVEFTGPLGQTLWFRRGALICYREWYGCDPADPAKGIQMRNEAIAEGMIIRTTEKTSGIVLTDSLPFQDRGMSKNGKAYRVSDVFAEAGVPLVLGNCARVTGWTQLRDRLIGIDGDPLILWQESCKACREYIPALGRSRTNPEDAEESGEATHAADCCRLACTSRPITVDEKKPALPIFPTGQRISAADIIKQALNGRHLHSSRP